MSAWQRNLGVGALLLAILALRATAITRAAFNWDELALFDSVARTLEDGVLRSGGRPGLAQLLVMPLVDACSDEAFVGRMARGLWLAVTTGYLAGLFVLLRELLHGRERRDHDALLGVALLALVPAFLEWSLQVRTDQIALCGAVWGGVALLRSERQTGLALAAGLAFGLGWLSSQKLAYAAALTCALALGRLLVVHSFTPRREAWRGALVVAGFGTVLLCFRALLMWLFTLPETHAARQVLGAQVASAHQHVFPFYRNTIGYSQYARILPTLIPHCLLALGLAIATLLAWRRGRSFGWTWVAWSVAGLGIAVGLYHAAAFAYFWMTLGLFPAVMGAIAAGEIREQLLRGRAGWRMAATAVLWLTLLVPAATESALLLRDTQAVQRESLRFVHRNFAPDQAGFHPEGGLFCKPPQAPGVWFSQRIFRQFESPQRAAHALALEHYFRSEPVHYVVESFRLNQFPTELRRFWSDHYLPYRGSVFVAGRRFGDPGDPGDPGDDADDVGDREQSFELLVSGSYRWLPYDDPHTLQLDGVTLEAGASVAVAAGAHTAVLPSSARGVLVLSLGEPPGPAPLAFYEPS